MDDLTRIRETIEKYAELKEISVSELYIDMQLGFDQEEQNYVIEYGIKDISVLGQDGLVPKLRYDSIEEAWQEYIEQFSEIQELFPEARKLLTHPQKYESAQLGGNPAERIVDETLGNL
ncbi:MAG: hypothetical protein ACI8Z7_000091 [Candidatus Nanohaloarchaea archaeon]|jgi:hypothetical protein